MKKAPEGAFFMLHISQWAKAYFFFATTRIISRHWWA